jgi:hypothetical protein
MLTHKHNLLDSPFLRAMLLLLLCTVGCGPVAATGEGDHGPEQQGETMAEHGHGGRKNKLAGESSPYLLLHQYNPVDWYPWGEEALDKARRENKPIFLSVGYSTCYWCHVMERESFSNPAIADYLNEHFVSIKVDREERPDLDEIYMTATQILTRQGGWPNSLFLTAELKPFYAGTYFPPQDRGNMAGFPRVLQGIHDAWENRRGQIEGTADEVAEAMRAYLEEGTQPTATVPPAAVAGEAFTQLARRFDPRKGGFSGAPKFPSPSNLYLLLALLESEPRAGEMLTKTLDEMARGGIYDQLGGGFHRYATDAEWIIPHFEKMLYDNAFLLELYAREFARTGDPQAERIVRETAAFLAREMTSPEGALWSAIDAETDGEEGAFYVWTKEELEVVLGKGDHAAATFLAPLYGFADAPFFEGDHYVLHLPQRLAAAAAARDLTREALVQRIAPLKEKLFQARAERERPLTDDKVLADWNGMAIAGLAVAGRLLKEEALVDQAARAADFVLAEMKPKGGTLLHAWRGGQGKIPAYLADYAYLVRGLLALHAATGEARWQRAAVELTEEQIRRLRDPRGGYFAAAESPDLLMRSKDVYDGAIPSANAIAVLNLLDLAERTGEARFRTEAEAALKAFGQILEKAPGSVPTLATAAHRYGAGGQARVPAASPLEALARQVVAVSAEAAQAAGEDGWRSVTVRLVIEKGWHINANPASDSFLIPTALEMDGEAGAGSAAGSALRQIHYPPGKALETDFAEAPIAVYEGTVEITAEVPAGVQALRVTYQPCEASRCLAPVTEVVEF